MTKEEMDAIRKRVETLPLLGVAIEHYYRDVPRLLDEVTRLEAENQRLRKGLNDVHELVQEGVEIYCDVNPEDCDHCVVLSIIDDVLEKKP